MFRPDVRLLPLVFALLVGTGCRTAPATVPTAAPQEPRVIFDVPLTFEAEGRPLPVPLVAVTVGGHPTKLIVDTGASHHVLTTAFARAIGQTLTSASAGQDHAGQGMATWEAGTVQARFADVDVQLTDVAAIEGPPPFEPLGIGGLLSPQHLHPTAHAVLDFTVNRLLLVEGAPSDVAAWAAKRWGGLTGVTLARANDDRKIMVQAAIEPFASVVTELDSGGSGTEALAAYVADVAAGATTSGGVGVSGGGIDGVPVTGRNLLVGGRSIPIPSLLVRPDMGGHLFTSLVGMDVLRGTVLVVSSSPSNAVFWLVNH